MIKMQTAHQSQTQEKKMPRTITTPLLQEMMAIDQIRFDGMKYIEKSDVTWSSPGVAMSGTLLAFEGEEQSIERELERRVSARGTTLSPRQHTIADFSKPPVYDEETLGAISAENRPTRRRRRPRRIRRNR